MGDLVQLRQRPTCFACTHYSLAYCHLYQEEIESELFAAMDCPDYEVET